MPRSSVSPAASTPSGSETDRPSIWYPPHTPNTSVPPAASFRIAASSPRSRSQRRSAIVLFVPGRRIISGVPSAPTWSTYRSDTFSYRSNGEKSVKFEIFGSRMTAMSTSFRAVSRENRSVRLSSSSMSAVVYGTTPATGTPQSASSCRSPGSRMARSPRNLFTIVPLTRVRSSGSSSAIVP